MSVKELPITVATGDDDDLPPGTPNSRKRAWAVTAVLVGCSVVVFLDKALLGLVAKPMSAELGLSATAFGSLSSASYVLFGLACIVGSFAAQRISPKWILLICGLCWSVGQIPAVFAMSGIAVYASRLLVGAAEGPANPVSMTSLYSWFPNKKRGLPQGLFTSGASLAKIALAPVLTIIIVNFGWRAGFITVSALAMIWSIAWFFVGKLGPYGARTAGKKAAADDVQPVPADVEPEPRMPWRKALLNRTFIACFLAYFVQNALAAVIFTWLPSYFQNALGFSATAAGSMLALPSAVGLVALLGIGALTDRLLRRHIPTRRVRGWLGGGLLALAGLFLIILPSVQAPLAAVLLIMLGYGISVTINVFANPVSAELVPPAQRSGILGVLTGLSVSSGIISPIVAGVILDHAATPQAGYGTAFMIFGAALVIAGALFALLVNPQRDSYRSRTALATATS